MKLTSLFFIYLPQGILKATWTTIRIFILPFTKLNRIIPYKGTIIDIGCGNGGLTNYLSLFGKRTLIGIDLSSDRISSALKSKGQRKNIKFLHGDATKIKLPKSNCYIMIDVLHHIPFYLQLKLIEFLSKIMDKNTLLVIKEVDPSNRLQFLFGHIIEKALYPNETIYARGKKEWLSIFKSFGLSVRIEDGIFYFPDSTKIFVLRKSKI